MSRDLLIILLGHPGILNYLSGIIFSSTFPLFSLFSCWMYSCDNFLSFPSCCHLPLHVKIKPHWYVPASLWIIYLLLPSLHHRVPEINIYASHTLSAHRTLFCCSHLTGSQIRSVSRVEYCWDTTSIILVLFRCCIFTYMLSLHMGYVMHSSCVSAGNLGKIGS